MWAETLAEGCLFLLLLLLLLFFFSYFFLERVNQMPVGIGRPSVQRAEFFFAILILGM